MTRPTVALVGPGEPDVLRAAGWQVRGSLLLTPYDDPADVPSYASLGELLADEGLDAVSLAAGDPLLARQLPAVLAAGRHVLLPEVPALDPDLLREARAADGAGEVAVALLQRWEPWAVTVAAAVQVVGTPVLQVTVRGWPVGAVAAAELVDLASSWCGEVVAVAATPAPLPADTLPDGFPVAWSLLHLSGATTLVSHAGAPALARLSFAAARLEAGPLGARWLGGAELPLLDAPDRRPVPHPARVPPGTPAGLLGSAAWLAGAVGGEPDRSWPWPGDLSDLQVAGRVLEALRTSARDELPVPVT